MKRLVCRDPFANPSVLELIGEDKMIYTRLSVPCDLSQVPLQEAAEKLSPSRIYDLYVSSTVLFWTAGFLHRLGADVQENPFAPYINLHADLSFKPGEWCLSANGRAFGSEGAT